MKKLFAALLGLSLSINSFAQSTIVKYLSGTDKDNAVQWDFFCTDGRLSQKWTKIAVPSNWELQGFGTYNYGGDKDKAHEEGLYKHQFTAGAWTGKRVFIVFEGSMTDTEVMINGKQAGPIHQGAFYRFKYDITDLIKPNAQNLLEVTVSKMSANKGVNDAERNRSDFWVFGGIFRPVYLEITPDTYIDRTAVNAKADGSFTLDVYANNLQAGDVIEGQVQTLKGVNVGKPFTATADPAAEFQQLKSNFINPKLWNAEFPNLYQVVVSIKGKKGAGHRIKQKFGFRTVEVRPQDGVYVNGTKVVLKGTCRHSFWPESGRALSHKIQLMDVKLIKDMNNNAVRMSHYPPDQDFLDLCDSLGVYVLDELTGWQSKYDTEVGRKLVKETVVRDVNHPSILFWDNGNEGGWNTDLDNDYALYDPQKRTVLHPWSLFNNVDTKHYPDYNGVLKATAANNIFMPTEFMHGLYDGGHAAGLEDFWDLMYKHKQAAGGFLWALVDENVIRTDKNNIYDGNGNRAPDGLVGPHREKEASFFGVKEIWSPVYIKPQPIDKTFDGKITVENRYDFTKLSQCKFKWKLVKLPSAQAKATAAVTTLTGVPAPLEVAPHESGTLNLKLPANWASNDALYLTAYGPYGEELYTWTWAIKSPATIAKPAVTVGKYGPVAADGDSELVVTVDGKKYYFDKSTGYIAKVVKGKKEISLSGGPVLAGVNTTLKTFTNKAEGKQYIVEADYQGEAASLHVKWTLASGKAAKLDYSYTQTGDVDFMGITFNYPEEKVTGLKWLGRGPFRVWKNRVPGMQFGVWHKAYNNTITGDNWGYPEFKGYHGEVNWATIENKESPFTVYTDSKNMYLQIYRPAVEKDPVKNVIPAFPDGSIGFLDGISAIGTKFQASRQMGPQSQKYHLTGNAISNTLWFEF
ncbi:MAG: glycoside hydrolase family 2 TIM barrel-domain containing protein [Bacteroidota bacterium]